MSAAPIVDTALVHEDVPGLVLEGDQLRLTLFPSALIWAMSRGSWWSLEAI